MWPSVLMMLTTSLYSIIDGWFVSNYAGKTALAAINLVSPIIMIAASLGLVVGAGGTALVSKTLGEGHLQKASHIFSQLIEFTIIGGILFSILGFIFAEEIVFHCKASGLLLYNSIFYFRCMMTSLTAFMLQMAFHSLFMTAEKPQMGMILSWISCATNIVLDTVLVAWMDWGLAGAAYATVISQLIGGIYPIIYFLSPRNTARLKLQPVRWQFRTIIQTCTNGLSEFVGNIAFSIASICYNLQLLRYCGEDGVAAFGVLMYISFFFSSVFIGFNITVSPLIGFNYGAQNHTELKSLLRKCIILTTGIGIAIALFSELLRFPLAGLFVGYNPPLMQLTTHAFRIYMPCFALVGFNMFVSAFFTSLGNGLISAFAAFMRSIVFEISSIFLLPIYLGTDGIWWSACVAEGLSCITAISLLITFKTRYRY